MAKNKKRKNNKINKKVIKQENNIKPKGAFATFTSKKLVRVVIHIITAVIWISFLADFLTFQSVGGYPNPFLAILALVTLILEWNLYRAVNKK